MTNTEIRPIPNFDGYFASTEGFIYSNKRGMLKQLKGYKSKTSEYLQVGLRQNGKTYKKLVHRLVAMTFIPNKNNLPEINHIDKNVLNNNISNLEWCTRKQNLNDSYSTKSPTRNYKVVRLYHKDDCLGKFEGITKAAKYASKNFNVSYSSLNKYLKSGDFYIKYEDGSTRKNNYNLCNKTYNKKNVKIYRKGYRIKTCKTFVEAAEYFRKELQIQTNDKILQKYCIEKRHFKKEYFLKRE